LGGLGLSFGAINIMKSTLKLLLVSIALVIAMMLLLIFPLDYFQPYYKAIQVGLLVVAITALWLTFKSLLKLKKLHEENNELMREVERLEDEKHQAVTDIEDDNIMDELYEVTQILQRGDIELALPEHNHNSDEVDNLSKAINHMMTEVREQDQIKKMLAQKEIERHRSVSEMVAGIAHEVNTPLGIVYSAASIIHTSLDEKIRKELLAGKSKEDAEELGEILDDVIDSSDLIQNNIKRVSDLIQRFKSLSVSQMSDELEKIHIIDKIEELIMLYKISDRECQLDIRFSHTLDDKYTIWQGYLGYLFQIIQNLLSNIDRYAYPNDPKGKVEISLHSATLVDKSAFCLQVKDFGVGMDEETISRIFDPFYTTGRDKGGSGLGMSIIYNIITSPLQGSINIKSEQQKGTTTTLYFPQIIEEIVETKIIESVSNEPKNPNEDDLLEQTMIMNSFGNQQVHYHFVSLIEGVPNFSLSKEGTYDVGRVTTQNVVIENNYVSSRHLQITYHSNASLTIIDLSSNGTLIDGKRLEKNTPSKLEVGQTLQLAGLSGVKYTVETKE
jgi:signal transduction histidine kinase